jgi:hypothetical protein
MASKASPLATTTAQESMTTPVQEELKSLQEIENLLAELWQQEVHQYEQTITTSSSSLSVPGVLPGGRGSDGNNSNNYLNDGHGNIHNCVSRNHANSTGTIENESLFPYHTALYPLLDCYDSILDGGYNDIRMMPYSSLSVVRPSPAPMPFELDAHRRSVNSPRIDRHGIHVEELDEITEHLPNSAWAVQQSLFPHHRKLQYNNNYMEYQMKCNNDHHQISTPIHHNENQDLERFRKDDYRFWNVLLNPELEAWSNLLSEDLSMLSEAESDNDEWEENFEDTESDRDPEAEPRYTGLDRMKSARYARDFRFLRWWRRAIILERRGVIHGPVEVREDRLTLNNDRYSPESLFADSTSSSSAMIILLKVLKHALSDLQRELRLAQAVVLLIADWKLCDDTKGRACEGTEVASNHGTDAIDGVDCLRRLLLIISSEYFSSCGGYCHEQYIANGAMSEEDSPNHYCSDVSHEATVCCLIRFEIFHVLNASM